MKDGVAGENTHSTSLHPLTKEEAFDTGTLELHLYLATFIHQLTTCHVLPLPYLCLHHKHKQKFIGGITT